MNKRISILFVSQSFYPAIGGVSSLLMNLIHNLLPLGYIVHALHFSVGKSPDKFSLIHPDVIHHTVSPDEIPSEDLRGYALFKETIYQHLHGLSLLKEVAHISQLEGYDCFCRVSDVFMNRAKDIACKNNIDILHVQDYQLMLCLRFEHCHLKKVFSLHAPLLECMNDTVFEWLCYHIAEADAVTVSTPAFKDVALRRRFPPDKISVVQPLVDPAFQTEFRENNACTSFPTIPEGCLLVSCIQRIDAKSGHDQLLRAFADVVKEFPNARLLLVGGASFTTSISPVRRSFIDGADALIHALSLREHVIRLHSIDYFALPDVYETTHVACILSKMEEFGMSITEAMYYGLPCLVTDVGGLSLQVIEGVNGYKVSVGDVDRTVYLLKELLRSAALRARLGTASRTHYEHHSAKDKIVGQYDDLYAQLL